MKRRIRIPIVAVLMTAVLSVGGIRAPAGWHEGFESAENSWRMAGGDAQCRLLQHRRVQTGAHTGEGCEFLQLEGNGGTYVYVAHYVDNPPVIEELSPSAWIKSDRAGLRIAARIVLPRTADQRTGQPASVIILGEEYKTAGRWQQLRLENIPQLLTRQIHILRMQLGPQVDDREAYLDAVLLNVYGGPGKTNVWIDDLEVAGHATVAKNKSELRPEEAAWASRGIVRLPSADAKSSSGPRHSAKLVGGVLLVDDRPMFPRVIQHSGEPLATLKTLGFNTVWLRQLPTPELAEEAERLGLWLISPPPRPANGAELSDISPSFDRILLWNLGENLGEAELDATQGWSAMVRAADRRGRRPLICHARLDLRGYSRAADLLLLDRRPLGTSMEFAAYAEWVRRQPLLASPGTPVWTTVQTQPGKPLRDQLAAMDPGSPPPLSVAPEQIRLLAYTAVSAGSRGLVFLSDSPLDASDPDTRRRATALELLNLELDLLEPWAAAGGFATTAETKSPEITASVLRVDRAQMMLPVWNSPGAQCVAAESAAMQLPLVAPGVPEASNAYLLSSVGVKPLRRTRVAGGVLVSADEFDLTAQILLAHDPLIISAVHRRAARSGRRAAELYRESASLEMAAARSTALRLAARTPIKSSTAMFETAWRNLQESAAKLSAKDYSGTVASANRSLRSLRAVKRAYWDAACQGLASPATSPGALGFESLPAHWRMIDRLSAGRFGANVLAGGDFEDVGELMHAGWQNIFHADPDLRTSVDLAPQAARRGRTGLRMAVVAIDRKNPPAAVEQPPILFNSPTVNVEAGTLVCIHGWVRMPAPIEAGADGLLIFDSIGGEGLADRINSANQWRQFALYRIATQTGPMNVTFALTGLGEVWLDDVAVQYFVPNTIARR